MIERELKDITETDLQKLISDPVREGKTIEYKAELNRTTDEAKRKFLAGIASFANAAGGDIVYGMKAKDGVPESLQALPNFNPDTDILALRDTIRAQIEPKLFGIEYQPVQLLGGGYALVIRIRKTWAGPHMVTYNNDYHFYTRDLAGRRFMDISEIRAAFTLADSTVEKINNFRRERLGNIIAGETPYPLSSNTSLVLHLCPLRSFDTGFQCDLSPVRMTPPRPLGAGGWSYAEDFEGYFSYEGTERAEATDGYFFVFSTGCIEIVATDVMTYPGEGKLGSAYEREILEALPEWFRILKKIGAEAPVVVMLSVLGVKNFNMAVPAGVRGVRARTINRDQLIIPGVVVETLTVSDFDRSSPNNAVDIMRPLFDRIWNACGYIKSINFDRSGNWTARI